MYRSTIELERDAVDFESITVSGLTGLTATKVQPSGKRKRERALIQVQDAEVAWRTDPSSASLAASGTEKGPTAQPGDFLLLKTHNELSRFQVIPTGSNAVLKVHYYE